MIDSKMAILNHKGEIIATEGFHKGTDGNYYSNYSYEESVSDAFSDNNKFSFIDRFIEIVTLFIVKISSLFTF